MGKKFAEINDRFINQKWEQIELADLRHQIARNYLGVTDRTDFLNPPHFTLAEILEKVTAEEKLPVPDFKFKHPLILPNEIPERWGFSAEPGIAELVILMNCLGLYTSSSCEGHEDRMIPCSQLSFWNESFVSVIACLNEWQGWDRNVTCIGQTMTVVEEVKGSIFDLWFNAPTLEESRELVNGLVTFIKQRSH
jgi:hypothetical protein